MPASVDKMINTILKHEGGFVNDPDDPGGATNFGVTLETYRRYIDPQATVKDIENMSKSTARDIYKKQYYYATKIDQLPINVRPQVFDMAVNAGPKQAIKIYQRCIDAKADGNIGPKTIELGEKAIAEGWHSNEYVDKRIEFYEKLVKRKPVMEKFLKGWIKRANSFRQKVGFDKNKIVTLNQKELAKLKAELKREIKKEVLAELKMEIKNKVIEW